jgi:hypothetical protein
MARWVFCYDSDNVGECCFSIFLFRDFRFDVIMELIGDVASPQGNFGESDCFTILCHYFGFGVKYEEIPFSNFMDLR